MRTKLLLVTNRKLHMHFRLAPRLMTLDDLELLFELSDNFTGFCRFRRQQLLNECQRQHCNPLNVLFSIMFFVLICRRFLRWGLHTRSAVAHLL